MSQGQNGSKGRQTLQGSPEPTTHRLRPAIYHTCAPKIWVQAPHTWARTHGYVQIMHIGTHLACS